MDDSVEQHNFDDTVDVTESTPLRSLPSQATSNHVAAPGAADELSSLLHRLNERHSEPVTSISSFMAAVTIINPPFKPRTMHRPWSISAGQGRHGSVEVHRYVPGRNFNVFNDSHQTATKLTANSLNPKRTGEYYAVKRLLSFNDEPGNNKESASRLNPYAQLANELRILAHKDLRGHPNILYLFGVSYTPSRDGHILAEPNLVLQEGDCGDLFSFYRDTDVKFINSQTLVEVKMSLCWDIACGLEALHRHGVVHCDLKPKNILIRRRFGRNRSIKRTHGDREVAREAIRALTGECSFVAVLADFGGSLILSDDMESTSLRSKVWTPLWCAPECYDGAPIPRDLLAKTDIYSAGLIFAFILLEGRDIFTQVEHRGNLHEYDVSMDAETVRELKVAELALDIAIEQVSEFETCFFAVDDTGERTYFLRERMYPEAYLEIFEAILSSALQSDPTMRVGRVTQMLDPWKHALLANIHLINRHGYLHYQQPDLFEEFAANRFGPRNCFNDPMICASCEPGCFAVPPAFPIGTELSPGVFDVTKSFATFMSGLTSGLKTEILNDFTREVDLVQCIEKATHPRRIEDVVPLRQLRRAADIAYQLGLACLDGFGRSRNDAEAFKWIQLSAEWGSMAGRAACLPLSESLGLSSTQNDDVHRWAAVVVRERGDQSLVNGLWRSSEAVGRSALSDFREKTKTRTWAEFEGQTGIDGPMLFESEMCGEVLQALFEDLSVNEPINPQNGWRILHYAAFSGHLDAVKCLVTTLGSDICCMSIDGETAADIAMAGGHYEVVLYLLEKHGGVEPNFKSGSCPLQNIGYLPVDAIPQVVYTVLTMPNSPEIDATNIATGSTALLNTVQAKEPMDPEARKKAIETLLSFGASPLGAEGKTMNQNPFNLAIREVDEGMVDAMLGAIDEHAHGGPAQLILNDNHLRILRSQLVFELGWSFLLLMKAPRSVTLLHGGRQQKQAHANIVKTLLLRGAAHEIPTITGGFKRGKRKDAMSLACYYGKEEAMPLIMDFGGPEAVSMTLGDQADTTSIDSLMGAIDCGFVEAVDYLLPLMMDRDDIADYNILNSAIHHQPALVPQVFSHFERAGKGTKLLEYVDPWGATALDLALEYSYFDLAKYLVGKGATYDVYRLEGDHSVDEGKQSTLGSVLPRMEAIKFLMGLDPKPSLVVTSTGLNVFHILATDENLIGTTVGRAEFLNVLDHFYHLDPSLIHARGGTEDVTPFHLVSINYSEILGKFLYERGADVNALSGAGYTPLDILHFHDSGERAQEQRLTLGSNGEAGVAVCDYAFAGPVYWFREHRLSKRMISLFGEWGGKRRTELRSGDAALDQAMGSLRIG